MMYVRLYLFDKENNDPVTLGDCAEEEKPCCQSKRMESPVGKQIKNGFSQQRLFVSAICDGPIHDRKLEYLIEAANGQCVLIAYWYKHDRERIVSHLGKMGIRVRDIKNSEDITDWNAGTVPVALIHPASAGHGLNIQKGGQMEAGVKAVMEDLYYRGMSWAEVMQKHNISRMALCRTKNRGLNEIAVYTGSYFQWKGDSFICEAYFFKTESGNEKSPALEWSAGLYMYYSFFFRIASNFEKLQHRRFNRLFAFPEIISS